MLVPNFLDWCEVSRGARNRCPFVVCALLRPGDEVQCAVTGRRARLPERAVRLVGVTMPGHPRCVHAVTSSGRSSCVNALPGSTYSCRAAAICRETEDHGGATAFATSRRAAFVLCEDGVLLLAAERLDGTWCLAQKWKGRFSPFIQSNIDVATLREDGELLLWGEGGPVSPASAPVLAGRATRMLCVRNGCRTN